MKNFSGTVDSSELDPKIINVFNYVLYSLVLVIGVPGNVLVVWSLMSIRREQVNRSYKLLVINLAVNDIMLVLLTVFTIAELANGDFPFGAVMCVILYPLQTACFGVGVFNMVALNVHRYYVISYSSSSRSLEKMTAVVVVLSWLLPTVITALPYAVHLKLKTYDNRTRCGETWSESSTKAYTLYLFTVQYILPLLIIATLNTLTIRRLKRGRLFRMNYAKTSTDSLHAHKRIVKMLVFIVLIFALFGLPGQIMWLLPIFIKIDTHSSYFSILSLVDIFPFMYCVLNPVLFFTYNIECYENIKKLFSSSFFCQQYHWQGSRHLSSTTRERTDAAVTLLPTTRISESQDNSQSDGPKFDPYATAIPKYLLEKHNERDVAKDLDSTSGEVKQCNGSVLHTIEPTFKELYSSDSHLHGKADAFNSRQSVPHVLGDAVNKELFRESFVELLKTRNLNSDLARHLEASPETAIVEESIYEASEFDCEPVPLGTS